MIIHHETSKSHEQDGSSSISSTYTATQSNKAVVSPASSLQEPCRRRVHFDLKATLYHETVINPSQTMTNKDDIWFGPKEQETFKAKTYRNAKELKQRLDQDKYLNYRSTMEQVFQDCCRRAGHRSPRQFNNQGNRLQQQKQQQQQQCPLNDLTSRLQAIITIQTTNNDTNDNDDDTNDDDCCCVWGLERLAVRKLRHDKQIRRQELAWIVDELQSISLVATSQAALIASQAREISYPSRLFALYLGQAQANAVRLANDDATGSDATAR